MFIKIFCDGGARGNPGPAAIGVIAHDETSKPLFKISQKIGTATNNQAEYQAVIAALERLQKELYSSTRKSRASVEGHSGGEVTMSSSRQARTINHTIRHVQFFLDSELLVKQLNQEYKVKNPALKELFWQIRDLVLKLGGKVSFCFVGREENKEADRLVNRALDN